MQLVFKLRTDKETKNCWRFQELTEAGDVASYDEYYIGELYVQKTFFMGKPSHDFVTVNIEVGQPAKEPVTAGRRNGSKS